jgi:hypothetical protein
MQIFDRIPIIQKFQTKTSSYKWISLFEDYQGNMLANDIQVSLTLYPTYLSFLTKSQNYSKPLETVGSFKEGLWKDETSEIFIFNKKENNYQEFNVSPKGYFWGMNFTSYRVRSGPNKNLEYASQENIFELKIPLESLTHILDSDTIISISGVFNNGSVLYSLNPNKDKEPDFHLKESALPIVIYPS